jgi:hypothetical protein
MQRTEEKLVHSSVMGVKLMKSVKTAITAVVLGAALCSQAEANSTVDLGLLNYGQSYSFGDLFSTAGPSFIDTVSFKLGTGLSDLGGVLGDSNISGFTATVSGGSLIAPLPLTSSYLFTDLSQGTYTMTFKGASTGTFPSIYGTFFSVAAVPEPDTWLMLVIGAGLVGFQLRRKQKVLRHRPLQAG